MRKLENEFGIRHNVNHHHTDISLKINWGFHWVYQQRLRVNPTVMPYNTNIHSTYKTDMPQWTPAKSAAGPNSDKLTRVMVGAIVSGPMKLSISPNIPVNPMKTWKQDATIMAPWSSLILLCHSAVAFARSSIVEFAFLDWWCER